MTSWTDYQDDISDAISDSMDVDWSASVGARAVVAWLNEHRPLSAAPAPEGGAGKSMGQRAYENMRDNNDNASRAMNSNKSWAELSEEERRGWEEDANERPRLYGLATREEAQPAAWVDPYVLQRLDENLSGVIYTRRGRGARQALYTKPQAREEAPAEAGELIVKTPCQHCLRMTTVTPESLALYRDHLHAQPKAREDTKPVEVTIFCPKCALPHVDEGEWATTRHHKTHQCQGCGHEWRPFPFATVGVAHPIRKDAQPVAWRWKAPSKWKASADPDDAEFVRNAGVAVQPLYTHPAPDALRVAVEALRDKGVVCRNNAESGSADERDAWSSMSKWMFRQADALAALQAERGAK